MIILGKLLTIAGMATTPTVRIVHLYPELMNLYGDRGNVLTLVHRCSWRGIPVTVTDCSVGEPLPEGDLYFIGGGQDAQQHAVCQDIIRQEKSDALKKAVANGAALLAICGGYQLLGHYFDPIDGERIPGIGLLDLHTVGGQQRLIGNVVIQRPDGTTLVGFENHSGQTFLGEGVSPLGQALTGHGNNGQTGEEGVATTALGGLVVGTYLHGSLLPKNPELADELLATALQHANGGEAVDLPHLDDTLEICAHQAAVKRPA